MRQLPDPVLEALAWLVAVVWVGIIGALLRRTYNLQKDERCKLAYVQHA